MKTFAIIALIIIVLVLGYLLINREALPPPTSFEECLARGYPVAESYPRQCRADNKTFVENIGNILEKENLIRIISPRPGDLVTSPLTIVGEARGNWYFEASFPVKLLDANGNVLVQHYAEAQDEWMTTNFVPFKSTINFTKPNTSTGTLVLEKDNPSGLPEHADEVYIPVRF